MWLLCNLFLAETRLCVFSRYSVEIAIRYPLLTSTFIVLPLSGKRCISVVNHHEKRSAFQMRRRQRAE